MATVLLINVVGFIRSLNSGDEDNKDGKDEERERLRKENEVVIPTFDELTQATRNNPEFEKMKFMEKNEVIKKMRAQ